MRSAPYTSSSGALPNATPCYRRDPAALDWQRPVRFGGEVIVVAPATGTTTGVYDFNRELEWECA